MNFDILFYFIRTNAVTSLKQMTPVDIYFVYSGRHLLNFLDSPRETSVMTYSTLKNVSVFQKDDGFCAS